MRMLSLCSGIGGIDYAAAAVGMEIVGQVEINAFRSQVLEKRFPGVKRMKDIKEVKGHEFGRVDIVAAGFPCQPHSLAGKRQAGADERDLWPQIVRVLGEVKPGWFLGENVPGLLSSENGWFFGSILADLVALGFRVGWGVHGAYEVGAPHRRERIFIVAYSGENRLGKRESQQEPEQPCSHTTNAGLYGEERIMAFAPLARKQHADLGQREGSAQLQVGREQIPEERDVWPDIGRCSDVADAQGAECQWSGDAWRGWDRSADDCADVADAASEGLPQRGSTGITTSTPQATRRLDTEPERCRALAHADIQRCEECSTTTVAAGTGIGTRSNDAALAFAPLARKQDANGKRGSLPTAGQFTAERVTQCHTQRAVESGLGGMLDGVSSWLARHRWPAGPGEPQHEWEPPRTVKGKVKQRRAKLEALGDSVVPQQVYPLLAEIYRIEMGLL